MNKNEMNEYRRCEYMIYIYQDAQGNDLCESLNLPEYPGYQCEGNAAANGCEMCREHDAYADHWNLDWIDEEMMQEYGVA